MVRYKFTTEILKEAVKCSQNFCDVARYLGTKAEGSRVQHLRDRIKKEGIDHSHFTGRRSFFVSRNKLSPEEVLVKDRLNGRRESGKKIRRALLEIGVQENCALCGQGTIWNEKPITLHVDHINGESTDNRIENLRLLCPNCHSQTETHSFRNTEKYKIGLKKKENKREKAKKPEKKYKRKYKKRPQKTEEKKNEYYLSKEKFKIDRDELEKLVWSMPTVKVAELFNVSDNAIARRCKKYGIQKPPRGYWEKKKHNKI